MVDEIEKQFKAWKPVTYDVARQIKAIEAFEATAVKSAEDTKGVVDGELKDLERTLKNIEDARPFDQLSVVSLGSVRWFGKHTDDILRMILLPLSRRLISELSNWFRKDDGSFLDML